MVTDSPQAHFKTGVWGTLSTPEDLAGSVKQLITLKKNLRHQVSGKVHSVLVCCFSFPRMLDTVLFSITIHQVVSQISCMCTCMDTHTDSLTLLKNLQLSIVTHSGRWGKQSQEKMLLESMCFEWNPRFPSERIFDQLHMCSAFVHTIVPLKIWALDFTGAWSVASNRLTKPPIKSSLKWWKEDTLEEKSLYSFHLKYKIRETLKDEHPIPTKF